MIEKQLQDRGQRREFQRLLGKGNLSEEKVIRFIEGHEAFHVLVDELRLQGIQLNLNAEEEEQLADLFGRDFAGIAVSLHSGIRQRYAKVLGQLSRQLSAKANRKINLAQILRKPELTLEQALIEFGISVEVRVDRGKTAAALSEIKQRYEKYSTGRIYKAIVSRELIVQENKTLARRHTGKILTAMKDAYWLTPMMKALRMTLSEKRIAEWHYPMGIGGGFVMWNEMPSKNITAEDVRFYINLKDSAAAERFVRDIPLQLSSPGNEGGSIQFMLKTAEDPGYYGDKGRFENTVLYLKLDDAARAAKILAAYQKQNPGIFGTQTPLFSKRICPGIAIIQEGETNEKSRNGMLAKVIFQALSAGSKNPEAEISKAIAGLGYNPEKPYLVSEEDVFAKIADDTQPYEINADIAELLKRAPLDRVQKAADLSTQPGAGVGPGLPADDSSGIIAEFVSKGEVIVRAENKEEFVFRYLPAKSLKRFIPGVHLRDDAFRVEVKVRTGSQEFIIGRVDVNGNFISTPFVSDMDMPAQGAFSVNPTWRRRNVGRALIAFAMAAARDKYGYQELIAQQPSRTNPDSWMDKVYVGEYLNFKEGRRNIKDKLLYPQWKEGNEPEKFEANVFIYDLSLGNKLPAIEISVERRPPVNRLASGTQAAPAPRGTTGLFSFPGALLLLDLSHADPWLAAVLLGAQFLLPFLLGMVGDGGGKQVTSRSPAASAGVPAVRMQAANVKPEIAAIARELKKLSLYNNLDPFDPISIEVSGNRMAVQYLPGGNNTRTFSVQGYPGIVFKIFYMKDAGDLEALSLLPAEKEIERQYRLTYLHEAYERDARRMERIVSLCQGDVRAQEIDGVTLCDIPGFAALAFLEEHDGQAGVIIQERGQAPAATSHELFSIKESLRKRGIRLRDDKASNAMVIPGKGLRLVDTGAVQLGEPAEHEIEREVTEAISHPRWGISSPGAYSGGPEAGMEQPRALLENFRRPGKRMRAILQMAGLMQHSPEAFRTLMQTLREMPNGLRPQEEAKLVKAVIVEFARQMIKIERYDPSIDGNCVFATEFIQGKLTAAGIASRRRDFYIPKHCDQTPSMSAEFDAHTILEARVGNEVFVIDTQLTQFKERNSLRLPDEFFSRFVYRPEEYYEQVLAYSRPVMRDNIEHNQQNYRINAVMAEWAQAAPQPEAGKSPGGEDLGNGGENQRRANKIKIERMPVANPLSHRTELFRYPNQLSFFRATLLPRMLEQQRVVLWSIGSSTGEEMATLFTSVIEALRAQGVNPQVALDNGLKIEIYGLELNPMAAQAANDRLLKGDADFSPPTGPDYNSALVSDCLTNYRGHGNVRIKVFAGDIGRPDLLAPEVKEGLVHAGVIFVNNVLMYLPHQAFTQPESLKPAVEFLLGLHRPIITYDFAYMELVASIPDAQVITWEQGGGLLDSHYIPQRGVSSAATPANTTASEAGRENAAGAFNQDAGSRTVAEVLRSIPLAEAKGHPIQVYAEAFANLAYRAKFFLWAGADSVVIELEDGRVLKITHQPLGWIGEHRPFDAPVLESGEIQVPLKTLSFTVRYFIQPNAVTDLTPKEIQEFIAMVNGLGYMPVDFAYENDKDIGRLPDGQVVLLDPYAVRKAEPMGTASPIIATRQGQEVQQEVVSVPPASGPGPANPAATVPRRDFLKSAASAAMLAVLGKLGSRAAEDSPRGNNQRQEERFRLFLRSAAQKGPFKAGQIFITQTQEEAREKSGKILKPFQEFATQIDGLTPRNAEDALRKFQQGLLSLLPDDQLVRELSAKGILSIEDSEQLYLKVRDYLVSCRVLVSFSGFRVYSLLGISGRREFIHYLLSPDVLYVQGVYVSEAEKTAPLAVPVVRPLFGSLDTFYPDARGKTFQGIPSIIAGRNERYVRKLQQIKTEYPQSILSPLLGQMETEEAMLKAANTNTAWEEEQHARDFLNPAEEARRLVLSPSKQQEREELRAGIVCLRYAGWDRLLEIMATQELPVFQELLRLQARPEALALFTAIEKIIKSQPDKFGIIDGAKPLIQQLDKFSLAQNKAWLIRLSVELAKALGFEDLFNDDKDSASGAAAAVTPFIGSSGDGPSPAAPAQPSAAVSASSDAKGGIDLTRMPVVTQPVSLGIIKQQSLRAPKGRSNLSFEIASVASLPRNDNQQTISATLEKQWQQIERMLAGGIIPSSQRIKEYLISCCADNDAQGQLDKILSCIAGILRLEEERCCNTDARLRQILVLLESDKPVNELGIELAKI